MASRKRENEPERSTNKLSMSTKKELAAQRQAPSCPSLPPKVRRRALSGRTLFNTFGYAKAVYFNKEIQLCKIYNRRLCKSYFDQIFEGKVKVGEGSFGCVYKTRHKEDGKTYAVKFLKEDNYSVMQKYAEIRNYEKVGENPYCIGYFGAWEEHDRFYIQMEYCVMSLEKYCMQNHSFTDCQLWDIFLDMLLALKHLHGKNYIHLDIKPENIMISCDGTFKLGDFGLLVDLDAMKAGNMKRVLNVSDGDGKYLASEVLDRVYTKSCDIFSLGITMLELATDLVLPSNGPLWHQLRKEALPDEYYQNTVPVEIRQLIPYMMRFEYDRRPPVENLLKQDCVKKVMEERLTRPRTNFLSVNNNNNENMDIPAIVTEPATPPSDRSLLDNSNAPLPLSNENVSDDKFLSPAGSTSTQAPRVKLFTA